MAILAILFVLTIIASGVTAFIFWNGDGLFSTVALAACTLFFGGLSVWYTHHFLSASPVYVGICLCGMVVSAYVALAGFEERMIIKTLLSSAVTVLLFWATFQFVL